MKVWPVQNAKSRFSELLDTCVSEGPQLVTRRGEKTAVLISISEWERLSRVTRPSLKSLLLADLSCGNFTTPSRGSARRRTVSPL